MKISIENLTKRFGDVKALDNVSLDIENGQLFFLLGPSGCGKTTLLRCIGGFERQTSGRILFDDKDVSSLTPDKRESAMVFQGYALFPHLTVYQNVAFGLEMQKMPRKSIDKMVKDAMKSVQIEQLADRKPNELSGGQQQRVALARTLVVHPGCLLLDEPLANLDAKLRRDMRQEIRRLCKDNALTGIYVTHDRQEALSMADKVAVLKDGQIMQIGSPREIYRKPASCFVASFIGDTNLIPGTIKGIEADSVTIETAAGNLLAKEAPKNAKAGDKVHLSIRPEAISLTLPAPNSLPATLKETAYLGEVSSHTATTNIGGISLDFLEMNPKYDTEGGNTTLNILPEDIIVLDK